MEMVCNLCYPDAVEYGEIFPGGWLMRNGDRYAVMAAHGHQGYELLFFPDRPTPNPDPECAEGLSPDEEKAADAWVDRVRDWQDAVLMSPEDGYFLVRGCKEAGCETSWPLWWLYDRAGKMIEEQEGW